MNYSDPDVQWATLNTHQQIIQLKKERNDFAKSRQEWIQGAFNLGQGDSALFDQLVEKELCDNCIRNYGKAAMKS